MPLRHIASWLPATPEEQQELTAAIAIAQAATPEADGFKIAINQGADFVAVPGPICGRPGAGLSKAGPPGAIEPQARICQASASASSAISPNPFCMDRR